MTFNTALDLRTRTSDLKSRKLPIEPADERRWVLLEPLTYDVGHKGSGATIVVEAGFVTDLASVPRFLWAIIPPFGLHAGAAVLHDWMYTHPEELVPTRKRADEIFHEAMLAMGVPRLRARIMYAAVRVGGRGGWKN